MMTDHDWYRARVSGSQVAAQLRDLVLDRPRLLLPLRRHSDVERYSYRPLLFLGRYRKE
jgi:hypothetical protein